MADQLPMTAVTMSTESESAGRENKQPQNQTPDGEGSLPSHRVSGSGSSLAQLCVLLSLGGFSPVPLLEMPYVFSLCSAVVFHGMFSVLKIFELFHNAFSYLYFFHGA